MFAVLQGKHRTFVKVLFTSDFSEAQELIKGIDSTKLFLKNLEEDTIHGPFQGRGYGKVLDKDLAEQVLNLMVPGIKYPSKFLRESLKISPKQWGALRIFLGNKGKIQNHGSRRNARWSLVAPDLSEYSRQELKDLAESLKIDFNDKVSTKRLVKLIQRKYEG